MTTAVPRAHHGRARTSRRQPLSAAAILDRRTALDHGGREAWIESEDGTRLYTAAEGTGPAVVFCNGLGVAADTFWPGIVGPLSRWFRTIRWDYAGHGRSDPPADLAGLTIERCARDLASVLDAWAVERAVIVGHSLGAQVALRFYRAFPERTAGLASVLGTFERPLDRFLRTRHSAPTFERLARLAERHPDLVEWTWPRLVRPGVGKPIARALRLVGHLPDPQFDAYLCHLRTMSPWVMLHLLRDMQGESERELLPRISVPTLIVAGERDVFTPVEVSREMHELVPGSRLRVIVDGSHAALAEQPELFVDSLIELLLAATSDDEPVVEVGP